MWYEAWEEGCVLARTLPLGPWRVSGGGLVKVSSERPERYSEVVRTGVAKRGERAGLLPLSPRGRVWGAVAVFRPDPGLSGPAFGGQPLPRLACLEGDLLSLPAGLGLPSFLWPLTLGLRGHLFLPAQPVLLSSSLDTLGPGTTSASLPFRLPPSPACDSSKFLLALAEVSWREEGPVFPNGPRVYTFLACWVETDRPSFFSALCPPTQRNLR